MQNIILDKVLEKKIGEIPQTGKRLRWLLLVIKTHQGKREGTVRVAFFFLHQDNFALFECFCKTYLLHLQQCFNFESRFWKNSPVGSRLHLQNAEVKVLKEGCSNLPKFSQVKAGTTLQTQSKSAKIPSNLMMKLLVLLSRASSQGGWQRGVNQHMWLQTLMHDEHLLGIRCWNLIQEEMFWRTGDRDSVAPAVCSPPFPSTSSLPGAGPGNGCTRQARFILALRSPFFSIPAVTALPGLARTSGSLAIEVAWASAR